MVTDGKNGFLYSTPEEFPTKMRTLLENKRKQSEIIDKAKAYIEEKHAHDKEIQNYISL